MVKETNLEVALCKEVCPICCKEQNGPIIMNTRLTQSDAQKVKKLHGQTIGYTEQPCDECKKMMKKGFVLIGVIEEKTEDRKNPYRSGNLWVIKQDTVDRIFKNIDKSKGMAFIDIKVAEMIGLPLKNK